MGFLDDMPDIIYGALGDEFFDCTLTRDGANSGAAYDPVTATPTVYPCKAIAEEYSAGIRGQGLVGATDVSVLILAQSLSVQPEPLDQIAIASQGISGVIAPADASGVKAVMSDPARATWQCRVVT